MENIAVIGAGTMGNGIAHVFAQRGFKVQLIDAQAPALEKAMATIEKNLDRQISKQTITAEDKAITLSNIQTSTSIEIGVVHADLVIEAATENAEIKKKIFASLDQYAKPACILATNTSSISIAQLAAATKRPTLVIGMHFMNPVPIMKLVEIINGNATAASVTDTIVALTKKIDKFPCVVKTLTGEQGIGVFIVDTWEGMKSTLQTIWKLREGTEVIFQEFLEAGFDMRIHVLNGKIIAMGSAVVYDEHFAFCGFYR
jgi:3-hydroxybutyryl-CoA dehydrogenase